MTMTETENKIYNRKLSIEKEKLFSLCNGEREIAKIWMTMLLTNHLKVRPQEAYQKALQLRPEREAFYHLI